MKESNTFADNVSTKQLHSKVLLNTKGPHMKESDTLAAGVATMKQPQRKVLLDIKGEVHEEVKYPCRQCDYQATTQGRLMIHKGAVHEGVKYPCRQCDHQATSNGDLARHTRAVYEGVQYPCRKCDCQATTQGNLAEHKRVGLVNVCTKFRFLAWLEVAEKFIVVGWVSSKWLLCLTPMLVALELLWVELPLGFDNYCC